eukprot:897335-Pelagomonas_calceolata.AAC.3
MATGCQAHVLTIATVCSCDSLPDVPCDSCTYAGAGLTGILSPVSICMGLTVVLVRLLNPDGKSGSAALRFASIAYSEDVSGLAFCTQLVVP